MSDTLEFMVRTLLIGLGATLVLDAWSQFSQRVLRRPAQNPAFLGRWVGHFPRGRFAHASIAAAAPVRGEVALGWITHFAVGIVFAALLLAIVGLDWARSPTLLPALVFGVVTVAAPFFVVQPALGAGVMASRTPNPNAARLNSLVSHSVFGLGLYLAALLWAWMIP